MTNHVFIVSLLLSILASLYRSEGKKKLSNFYGAASVITGVIYIASFLLKIMF